MWNKGIIRQSMISDTPQQKGVAERMNYIIIYGLVNDEPS